MDPRHPENAIDRMVDLMTQFNLVLKDIRDSVTSAELGQLEREGGLVVQEICLVAPRLHEAMMQASRNRRHELSHGIIFPEIPAELLKEPTPEVVENYVEKAKEDFSEKPKKKRKYTRKKKVEE